jgi:hypothetical protein
VVYPASFLRTSSIFLKACSNIFRVVKSFKRGEGQRLTRKLPWKVCIWVSGKRTDLRWSVRNTAREIPLGFARGRLSPRWRKRGAFGMTSFHKTCFMNMSETGRPQHVLFLDLLVCPH